MERKGISIFGWILATLLGVALFVGFTFLVLGYTRYFKPKFESVERKTFEETRSYDQGVIQDLTEYYHQWQTADEQGKRAIEEVVRMRFPEYPPERIKNPTLRRWFEDVISGRTRYDY